LVYEVKIYPLRYSRNR